MEKRKIGILGLGSIGKRHAENFKKLGCEVRGYDPGVDGWDRHQVVDWADAVVVATPTANHYADLMTIPLDKAVFVEKPIIDSLPLHQHVTNVKIVGYNLRFHSCVFEAREWLANGLIGKPIWARFVCAQHNDKPQYLRDGVILNWSHEIDLALYLLGKAEVRAAVIQDELEDMADIILQHHNSECVTTIHLDYLTEPECRGFRIVGEEGHIEVDLVNRTALLIPGNYPEIFFKGEDTYDDNYLSEAQAFLDRIDGLLYTIGCTAQEALDVVDICLTAKEMASG